MNDSAGDGETYKREVDPGSAEFLCAAYPRGEVSRDCVVDAVDSVKHTLDGGTTGAYECCGLGGLAKGCSSADGLLPGAAALLLLRHRRRRRNEAA